MQQAELLLLSQIEFSMFDYYLCTYRCFGEDTCITIPTIDAVVMVLQPSEPRITITGVERLRRPASDFRAAGGISLFQDLHIISTVTRADTSTRHTGRYYVSYSCKMPVPPAIMQRWAIFQSNAIMDCEKFKYC